MDNIESTPQPAVSNLRSRFEQLAVDTSAPPRRPLSRIALLDPGSPRQRASSATFVPSDVHHLRTSSSASDLKIKRPPPPIPPKRAATPTPSPSPSPSPLLRSVPLPPSSPSSNQTPRVSAISLIDADIDEGDGPGKAVAALRSKFLEPDIQFGYHSGHARSSSDVSSIRSNFEGSTAIDVETSSSVTRDHADEAPAGVTALRSKFQSHHQHAYGRSPTALPHFVAPPVAPKPPSLHQQSVPSLSHSHSSSSSSSNSSTHDPFFDHDQVIASPDTITASHNNDSLIDLGSPRSSRTSLSSPDTEVSQIEPSAPSKPARQPPPPPRPPPRHLRTLPTDTPEQPLPLQTRAPPLPVRKQTAAAPPATPVEAPTHIDMPAPPRLPQRHRDLPGVQILPASAPAAPDAAASPLADRRIFGVGKHPPPPTRMIALGDKLPVARKATGAANGEDSDEESEEEDAEAKGTDMLPDSSRTSRRPPRMQDVHDGYTIQTPIRVHSFSGHVRMSGTHVVVGDGHKIRLYDLAIQDLPLWTLDTKELGAKGATILSVEFRAGGRHVWIGTKEGHLFEVDVKGGQFTGNKLNAHLHSVVHIFRYGTAMVTVDDGGKVLVWTPESGEDGIRLSQSLPRAVRITEKVDFAKLINGMLWTAARKDDGRIPAKDGPQVMIKVPYVRVYDIFNPGCVGRTLFPAEHAGPVTSGAILPSDPTHAYIGHEEGYISIWDLETEDHYPRCAEVMKVSASDILCLEGVYNRLWAGSRSGTISAYDISQRPWVVTNCWNPHPGMPCATLQVDPFGVAQTGRLCVLSVSRDEFLMLWDGLLSLDWIDGELMKHEQSFSTFRDLKVLIVSWNCDAAKPDHLNGDAANVNLLHDMLTSVDSPDVISFGFQEVVDLESRKTAAKTIVINGVSKKHADDQPGAKVAGAYQRWFDRLSMAVKLAMPPDTPYTCILTESLVGLFSCIFMKTSERATMRDLGIAVVKRGMGGRYGNKGGIVARLVVEDSSICFINCHLAAGQKHVRSRNADVTALLESNSIFDPSLTEPLAFIGGGDGRAITDHEIIYLNGDMNYRIDAKRDNIVATVKAGEYESLLPHDQLLKEIKYNRGCRLRPFREGPIKFPPTYKYDRRTDEYDSSEKRRSPAWCDRVLWRTYKPERVEQLHYQRYEANVSDHRPISSAFRTTVKSVHHEVRQKYKTQVQMMWAKEEERLLRELSGYFAVKGIV